ncbi:hypothetical protein KSP35_14000 [Aquihabitans sp. G128]|uniref:hypothetical protein n=1 Tax=Aquihabitans sp. G128 TaxID=2849779 RepID=UPI001C249AC3|nr:hypothetical protein [Aquihabitans sp. G128]QXC59504.1 hypothetical protein KSP35_14000 [Aquihabitans sp. G128]
MSDLSNSRELGSDCQGYNSTSGDFYGALGQFVFIVKGDVWIEPANGSGVGPMQIRYRSGFRRRQPQLGRLNAEAVP